MNNCGRRKSQEEGEAEEEKKKKGEREEIEGLQTRYLVSGGGE